MNNILDDETYPIQVRLNAAKIILELKDNKINELTKLLSKAKSERDWINDQSSGQRMGV